MERRKFLGLLTLLPFSALLRKIDVSHTNKTDQSNSVVDNIERLIADKNNYDSGNTDHSKSLHLKFEHYDDFFRYVRRFDGDKNLADDEQDDEFAIQLSNLMREIEKNIDIISDRTECVAKLGIDTDSAFVALDRFVSFSVNGVMYYTPFEK